MRWYASQIFLFSREFFFLPAAAVSRWPRCPTGRKPVRRVTQSALCFSSLRCFPTPSPCPLGLHHHSSFDSSLRPVCCRFMLVHLSFLSPSLPLGLFSPTVQQDLAEPGAAAKQPLPRSAAMCQSAAGPLLHLHFALLRGRTGRGDPSALQVWVVRAYSGICFFFPTPDLRTASAVQIWVI